MRLRQCVEGGPLHEAVARVVAQHLDPSCHRAWIIGSEASGGARPGADVDVAIEGSGPIDLLALARLRAALEDLPTLRSFDLVDLRRATERFRHEALRGAIPLALADGDEARV